MTQRLPVPGSDDGVWGSLLNGYLGVAHNSDGSLQLTAVAAAGAITSVNAVTPTSSGALSLSPGDIGAGTYSKPTNGIPATDLEVSAQTNLAAAATAVQTVNGQTGNSVSLSAADIGALTAAEASNLYAQLDNGTIPLANLPTISAPTLRTTSGTPTVLASDTAGDFAIDMANLNIYGPFNGTTWPAAVGFGAGVSGYSPHSWGYAGMTMPFGTGQPTILSSSSSAQEATLYFIRFRAYQSTTVSFLDYWLETLGANLVSGLTTIGLYDSGQQTAGSLTQLGLVDTSSLWGSSGTTGLNTVTLPSPVYVNAGEDYFILLSICLGTSGATAPQLIGATNQLYNPLPLFLDKAAAFSLAGVSSIGTVIAMSSLAAAGTTMQIGIR